MSFLLLDTILSLNSVCNPLTLKIGLQNSFYLFHDCKLFCVNLSEEFGVAGVLPQDSFCLIRKLLLITILLDNVLTLHGCCSFAYGASLLCDCSSKGNPPSQPITGNSFHLK